MRIPSVTTNYHKARRRRAFTAIALLLFAVQSVLGAPEDDCPWAKDIRVGANIKNRCQCARTPSPNSPLSIQCHEVETSQLISALTQRGKSTETLELLYLNSSKVTDGNGQVPPRIFRDVKMVSLQMSGCGIRSFHTDAFRGQENTLKHLSLAMNLLKDVPTPALERLKTLNLLDLSHNSITDVPDGAFAGLTNLTTLKLNDNNLELQSNAFEGLETSLKNLNLKGTGISRIPPAIEKLSTLAFLDLAQNRIRHLGPSPFTNLHSLAALNLERNLLQSLPTSVFKGVNDTLSSLSLLNNLVTVFPREALEYLHELRVLDLGFNLLTEIPENAFNGLNSLTLLALDGNPLETLPAKPFAPLQVTLRGLSLGGKFLNCDCRVNWITDWVQQLDLQVTSREKDPQFCGNPPELRPFNFYQLKYEDLRCEPVPTSSPTTISPSPGKSSITKSFSTKTEDSSIEHSIQRDEVDVDEGDEEEQSDSKADKRNIRNETTPKKQELPVQKQPVRANSKPATAADQKQTGDKEAEQSEAHSENTDEITSSTFKPFVKRIIFNQKMVQNSTTTGATEKSATKKPQPPTKSVPSSKSPSKSVVITTSTTSTVVSSISGKSNTLSSTTAVSPVENAKPAANKTELQFDDSKIPVITGVGPRVVSNSGSIVQVRVTPAPTTTQTPKKSSVPIITRTAAPTNHFFDNDNGGSPSLQVIQHHQIRNIHSRPKTSPGFTPEKSDIDIQEIERNGESVLVQWRSTRQNGFRIIYRIFGEETFRHGPPLAPTEREYRIQNVPYNECIVVCVIPYEEIVYNEISPSAASIPPGSQCRELKPASPSALMTHMDKIAIGASAIICFTVIVAILIFVAVTRRARRKREGSPIISKIPPGSYPTPSPGPLPIITQSSLNADKDWDQLSGVSSRSIPRARVYSGTMDALQIGNGPSRGVIPAPHHHHHHHFQHHHQHQRSIPDGHSTHRSYLSSDHAPHNQSTHSYNKHSQLSSGVTNYLSNQSRLLRASLGPRSTQDALSKQLGQSYLQRHMEQSKYKRKKGHKFSNSESLNTLSGYDTPDNWTDHDQEVYISQNATRRELVQF